MQLKRTIVDRIGGYFSPEWERNRIASRLLAETLRGYDFASYTSTADWRGAFRTSANAETRVSLQITRDRARDLTRNNPYAAKALNVIVSNTVGAGIVPKIKGRTKGQEKAINAKWKIWGETALCDKDRRHNFYGLQALALRSIVESGEALAKKIVVQSENAFKLQMLEPDYININASNNLDNIQGIWINKDTEDIEAYQLYKHHPGDYRSYNIDSLKVPVDQVIHAFKLERIGQIRGVPWVVAVGNILKDFADLQNATLIRQKVSACVTAFITEREGDAMAELAALKQQRQLDNNLEPGSIRYLAPGQTMTLASPPSATGYPELTAEFLTSIATGMGISREALTGDYSKVNFSSGRMGHLEFQRNIDSWRWQMLIPQFCDPSFKYFLKWCEVQGINTDGVTWDWTCPARSMIDPVEEIKALNSEVRSGFKSLPEAIRERGLDPELVLQEIADSNTMLDELKLILDSDPRVMTQQGMSQSIPPQPPDQAIAQEQAKQKAAVKAQSDALKAKQNNGDSENEANKADASKPSSKG